MQTKSRTTKSICLISILALLVATQVWAEDEIVPFDPNASVYDVLLYMWNFLKGLVN